MTTTKHWFARSLALSICLSTACGGSVAGTGEDTESDAPDAGITEPIDFEGFAIAPPGPDFKPKQPFQERLAATLARAEVPSVLGGAFVQVTRAYLTGRAPESDLERATFATLDTVDPDTMAAFARMIEGIDDLPSQSAQRLYDRRFLLSGPTSVLTADALGSAFKDELQTRISLELFNDADANECLLNERPGLQRTVPCFDIDGTRDSSCNTVCRVGEPGLRTSIRTQGFEPKLRAGDYEPEEIASTCTVDENNEFVCETVPTDECQGPLGAGGTCLTVPTAIRGGSVTFQGFNFFDVDAQIRLTNTVSGQTRTVPAHVCGDVTSGPDVTGCNVNDLITFTVPEGTPVGRYRVNVLVPSSEPGEQGFSTDSRDQPFLDVLPSADSNFELSSQALNCVEETRPERFGSDEVGLTVITLPVAADGTLGALTQTDTTFGNVDTGDTRTMDDLHFSGVIGGAVGVSIVGFEIDGQQAYKERVRGFQEAYALVADTLYGEAAGAIGLGAGGLAAQLLSGATIGGVTIAGGPALLIGAGVAAATTAVIIGGIALWSPPDLIMEDADGFDFGTMARLTSVNFQNPVREERRSADGIKVIVEPCEEGAGNNCEGSAKTGNEYRERRLYDQSEEDSRYELILRYRRTN